MGWEDADIEHAISKVEVPKKQEEPKVEAAPEKKVLSGRVEFTPEMERTTESMARGTFPQQDEIPLLQAYKAAMLPVNQTVAGAAQVPEDLANFIGGGAQQALGVPQAQRMSVGDLIRQVPGLNGYVTPGEEVRSPAYQREMAKNLYNQLAVGGGRLGGGFLAPVGAVEAGLSKMAAPVVSQVAPLMAKLGQAGSEVPILANAGQTAANLLRANQGRMALAKSIGSGAAYGGAFSAGGRFGQDRTFGDGTDVGAGAALGGALGAGAHALQGLLQKLALQKMLAPYSSQVAQQPSADMSVQDVPQPNQVRDMLNGLLTQNMLRQHGGSASRPNPNEPRTLMDRAKVQDRAVKMFQNKYGNESLEHSEEISKADQMFRKELLKARVIEERANQSKSAAELRNERAKDLLVQRTQAHVDKSKQVIDHRTQAQAELSKVKQGLQQQTAEHRAQIQQGSRQEARGTEAEQTHQGNNAYSEYRRRIESSQTPEEHNQIWTDLHTPAPGPKGKPVLRPEQRSDLKHYWQQEYERKFNPDEAAESETGKPSETRNKEPEKSSASVEPVRKFIEGSIRKTFDVAKYGARENRWKLATSVEKLAELGKLTPEETQQLREHVAKCAQYRQMLTKSEQESRRLAEWAFNNRDKWIGSQYDVKAYNPVDDKADYIALQHMGREGKASRFLLRSMIEEKLENGLGKQLVHTLTADEAGKVMETLDTGSNTARFTTCGKVDPANVSVKPDGSLKIDGKVEKIDLAPFTPPRTADQLFDQVEQAYEAVARNRTLLARQKEAGNVPGILEKVWQELKAPWINGEAPNVALHHIDEAGNLSVVEHQQPLSRVAQVNIELDEQLAKAIQKATNAEGKIDYKILRGQPAVWNKLLKINSIYLPGLTESGIVASVLGREISNFGRIIAEGTGTDLLFAGTVDDVFRNNAKFGGQLMSDAFHQMNAEIAASFFQDKAGEYVRIGGAEEFAELMNSFKNLEGKERNLTNFQRRALALAKEKADLEGRAVTEAEKQEALKKALTVNMISQKYKALNRKVEAQLEKMQVRRKDQQTGIPSDGGHYLPGEREANGTVKASAYSRQYHVALQELNKSLTFRSDNSNYIADFIGNASQAILGNRPATAIKNFFDQAPFTLAEFNKHFLQAVWDIHSNHQLKEAIERLPGLPQAELHLARLKDWKANARTPDWSSEPAQFLAHAIKWINYKLSVDFDPLFRGSSKLISAADHAFHVYSSLASLYKSAAARGVDKSEFVAHLIDGKLSKATTNEVMAEWSRGLSQTLNTVAPHLNKDLFASTTIGQATQQFSTPARRSMKMIVNLAREARNSPEAAAKLAGISLGLVALGGRGALPPSVQAIYRGMGFLTGNSQKVEEQLQNMDKWNVLRAVAGINYNSGFGPDWLTGSAAALESVSEIPRKIQQEPWGSETPTEQAWNLFKITALDGLHMFPRWGPFGSEVTERFLKDLDNAASGHKTVYYDGPFNKVEINDYNYWDAIRSFMVGGVEPKAQEMIDKKRMLDAKKHDLRFRIQEYRDLLPRRPGRSV